MRYHVKFPSGEEIPVEVTHLPTGEVKVSVNGKTLAADVLDAEGAVSVRIDGRVLKVLVREGDAITAGTPLVVVEAMKMENEILASRDGKVARVHVTPGSTVESGAKLVEIE